MYRVLKIRVKKTNPMYKYFSDICTKSKNMYNTANYLIRQNMTELKKPDADRQPNEKEAIQKTVDRIHLLGGSRTTRKQCRK